MIKYHWTGEYRRPKKGDWFLNAGTRLEFAETNHLKNSYWILRREETPDPGKEA